jgi:hypothetical protein
MQSHMFRKPLCARRIVGNLTALAASLVFAAISAQAESGAPATWKVQVGQDGKITTVEKLQPSWAGRTPPAKSLPPQSQPTVSNPDGDRVSVSDPNDPETKAFLLQMQKKGMQNRLDLAPHVRETVASPLSGELPEGIILEVNPRAGTTQNEAAVDQDLPKSGENKGPSLVTSTLTDETFEGNFPDGLWQTFASNAPSAYWDDVSNVSGRAYAGAWSMWCADAGSFSSTPTNGYRTNMNAWATYGPFDLTGVHAAVLHFKCWYVTENNFDFFKYGASHDNLTYSIATNRAGNSGGWIAVDLDLSSFIGDSSVWFAFVFTSDDSIQLEGAYVDNVVLETETLPDLHWTNMSVSDLSWDAGQSVTIALTEENSGPVEAGAHQTQLLLSDNDIITVEYDTALGQSMSFGAIAAHSSSTLSNTFNTPWFGPGTWYLGAAVDTTGAVAESDESNNIGSPGDTINTSALTPPDLTALSLSLSDLTWAVGQTMTVQLTEQSVNDLPAAAHQSQLYLSDNLAISDADLPLGTPIDFPSMASPSTNTQSKTFVLPFVWPGTYYLGALIDINGNVTESDKSNNSIARNESIVVRAAIKADFNRNGEEDVVMQRTDGVMSVWAFSNAVYKSTIKIQNGTPVALNWKPAGSGDFDKNGTSDLLFQNSVNGRIAVWLMNGGAVTSKVNLRGSVSVGLRWRAVGTGDFNHDGSPDVLFQHDTGKLQVWTFNGTAFSAATILNGGGSPGLVWKAVTAADIDRNAEEDVVFQRSDGRLLVWYFASLVYVNSAILSNGQTPGSSWRAAGVADFNSDGSQDVLFQNVSTGKLLLWFMNASVRSSAVLLRNGFAPGSGLKAVGPR